MGLTERLTGLLQSGQIKTHAPTIVELQQHLEKARRLLNDARREGNSLEGRFENGNSAGHSLLMAALKMKGYRPSGEKGHRSILYHLLDDLLPRRRQRQRHAFSRPQLAKPVGIRRGRYRHHAGFGRRPDRSGRECSGRGFVRIQSPFAESIARQHPKPSAFFSIHNNFRMPNLFSTLHRWNIKIGRRQAAEMSFPHHFIRQLDFTNPDFGTEQC